MLSDDRAAHAAKEAEVGITDYVSTVSPGFEGIVKKRYTDFLVNEILPNGRVVHLQNLGSAAAGHPDVQAQSAVPSAQGETNTPSLGLYDSDSMRKTSVTAIRSSDTSREEPSTPQSQAVEESTSPVRLLYLNLARKLTHGTGLC